MEKKQDDKHSLQDQIHIFDLQLEILLKRSSCLSFQRPSSKVESVEKVSRRERESDVEAGIATDEATVH
jgi:hypothetical protein